MKNVTIRLIGKSPYSQSRPHRAEKLSRENSEDYEARTWKKRMHINDDGNLILPGMSVKNCLAESAKFLGKQIPGKGKATYTKYFEAGILIMHSPEILDPDGIPVKAIDCDQGEKPFLYGDWIFTPSDGVRGSGKRVYRCYPVIRQGWSATVDLMIVDDTITQPVIEEHLKAAGTLIGLGRFRVRNLGMYGMFEADIISWDGEDVAA